jgi:hypothetical protein
VTAEQPERYLIFDGFRHHIFEGILPQYFGVFGAVLTGFFVDLSGFWGDLSSFKRADKTGLILRLWTLFCGSFRLPFPLIDAQ